MERPAVVVIVTVLVVASACSSGTGTDATTEGGGGDTTETTTAATASPTAEGATDSDSCVGTWSLDSEAFFDMYNETAPTADQIAFVDGAYVVTWNADGTFTDERADWTFEFPGIDNAGAMIMNSIGAGEWQHIGTETSVTFYELTDPQISMIIDGEEFELPVSPGSLPEGLFGDKPTVSCTDTVMTTSVAGYVSTLIRTG